MNDRISSAAVPPTAPLHAVLAISILALITASATAFASPRDATSRLIASTAPPGLANDGFRVEYLSLSGATIGISHLAPNTFLSAKPPGAKLVHARAIVTRNGTYRFTTYVGANLGINGQYHGPGTYTKDLAAGTEISLVAQLSTSEPFSMELMSRDASAMDLKPMEIAQPGRQTQSRMVHASIGRDSDGDTIADDWETGGYTLEQRSNGSTLLVAWDDALHAGKNDPFGNPYIRRRSSPYKAHTANDPFSDYQKVTGYLMPEATSLEARNPLVASAPDLQIHMDRYRLIPNTSWSSSTGGSNVQGVTQATSSSKSATHTAGGEVSCSASLLDMGCSVSVNYSYSDTTTVGHEHSSSNSTTAEWNRLLSGANAQAAILLPNIHYRNGGTAPLQKAYPLFTLALDGESLVSATSNDANMLHSANPGERYPRTGSLAMERVNDFQNVIHLDDAAFNRLKTRPLGQQVEDPLTITVTGFEAAVIRTDHTGSNYPSHESWTTYLTQMRSANAEITVVEANGDTVARMIAAKGNDYPANTIPILTLRDVLVQAFGATFRNGVLAIKGNPVDKDNFELIVDGATGAMIKAQAAASLLDVQMQPRMALTLRSIRPVLPPPPIDGDELPTITRLAIDLRLNVGQPYWEKARMEAQAVVELECAPLGIWQPISNWEAERALSGWSSTTISSTCEQDQYGKHLKIRLTGQSTLPAAQMTLTKAQEVQTSTHFTLDYKGKTYTLPLSGELSLAESLAGYYAFGRYAARP